VSSADDHGDDEEEAEEQEPDISEWSAATKKTTCPSCGAAGAVTLGGGVFCPTCGEVTMNPGYRPPADPPE
jgi:ribosomal protein S27AE